MVIRKANRTKLFFEGGKWAPRKYATTNLNSRVPTKEEIEKNNHKRGRRSGGIRGAGMGIATVSIGMSALASTHR